MHHLFAAAIYLLSIVAANLSVAYFGPASLPVNAFLLIGLDLSLRDYLHEAWADALALKMGALIGAGGLLTYLINPQAGWVALASCIAFCVAMAGDTFVYDWLSDQDYLFRANSSNLAGAVLDSTLFATIAFGPSLGILWAIAGQIVAKATGGAMWAWIIDRVGWREAMVAGSLLFGMTAAAQAQDLYVSAHYDAARGQPIVSATHDTPVPGTKMFATGFAEVWRNPKTGFPANEWVFFSKHWLTYPLTRRLSASLGVELLYNRPGVNFEYPQNIRFRPGDPKLHIAPKIGVTIKVW